MPFTIRPFELRDQDAAQQLIQAGLGEHFGWVDKSLNPDLKDIAASFTARRHVFLVAEVDGQLVGTGALLAESQETGRIVRVSVAPGYRRQGMGRALVRQLIVAAKCKRMKHIRVETNIGWEDAIGLYRACGFHEYGRDEIGVHLELALKEATMEVSFSTPHGNVIIRPAIVNDAPGYRDMRLEALRSHPEAFSADYAAALAHPMSFWIERLQASVAGTGAANFLAVQDHELVGMCAIFRGNTPKTQHSATIVGMYVRPEWRGLHIAEQLVNACVDQSREQGARIVKLAVVTTNARAIRAYVRSGFHVYGVEPEALCNDGVYYDELLMARTI